MKYSLFFVSILATAYFTACGKDKFTTEPQVNAKSVKPGTVLKGQFITFTSRFTDDEGDVQDSVLVVFKRYNGSTVLTTDTFRHRIPGGVPNARQGDITIHFIYGEIPTNTSHIFLNQESADREVTFGIIIKDNAGHRSNYSESGKITLKKV